MSDALDDAAVAALFPLSRSRQEHIGALYGEELARSNVVAGVGTKTRGKLQIPGGASAIKALFHNHPARSDDRYIRGARNEFSDDDTAQARRLNVPSYISAGEQVFRYDPSSGKTEEVLGQIPLEEIRRMYLARELTK